MSNQYERRLRELYEELRVQRDYLKVLREEVLKHNQRIQELEVSLKRLSENLTSTS